VGGATVDQEGLANNYAIEPEMYFEEPGDAKQEENRMLLQRAQESEANEDKEGELTMEHDTVVEVQELLN